LSNLLKESGRLFIVKSGTPPSELAGLLSFRYSHGHTPGQMLVVIHGENQRLMFAGDLIPGVAWVHVPITMGYDRFPELLIDEKKDLYKTASAEGWYLFFTHDPEIALAKVSRDEKGRFKAVEQVAKPLRMTV